MHLIGERAHIYSPGKDKTSQTIDYPSDLSIEAGLGFQFFFPVFILSPELKISEGIKNIHSRDPNLQYSNVIDKLKSRMIIFSLIFEG